VLLYLIAAPAAVLHPLPLGVKDALMVAQKGVNQVALLVRGMFAGALAYFLEYQMDLEILPAYGHIQAI
tara:strand:+ start:230 stop:436 length:207 start_codon:yes stop_codon:yes gene_type:complete